MTQPTSRKKWPRRFAEWIVSVMGRLKMRIFRRKRFEDRVIFMLGEVIHYVSNAATGQSVQAKADSLSKSIIVGNEINQAALEALTARIDAALAALGRLARVEADMAAKRIAAEDAAKPTEHDLRF